MATTPNNNFAYMLPTATGSVGVQYFMETQMNASWRSPEKFGNLIVVPLKTIGGTLSEISKSTILSCRGP
ncbi:hypothetical protein SK128_018424, partial [Halocaridina rubra]